jgi:hypothetical protein
VLPPKRVLTLLTLAALIVVAAPVKSDAQHVRVGVVAPVHRVVVVGGFYRPWFYDPWFGPWYPYGYGGFYQWGPYPYPYPYRYPYYGDYDAAVRLEVKPKEAEVYVDGYYTGIVDDFDGVFQRLPIQPGNHEITIYRDGYRTFHQTIYAPPRSTLKISHKMEKLVAGDVAEPRPTPPNPPPAIQGDPNQPGPPPPPPPPGRGPFSRRLPPPPPNQGGPGGAGASTYGALSIRVQPESAGGNAGVLIDGERWDGPQGQNRLIVEVSEGTHRIEIQRDGFEPYSTTVTVRRGETTPVNVSLRTR